MFLAVPAAVHGVSSDTSSEQTGAAADGNYETSVNAASEGCGSLTAAPVITAVVNAGSYRQQDGIAMNTMLAIFGSGFAPPGTSRVVGTSDILENRFPETLACVGVEIAGQTAIMAYISDTQINVQAPTNLLFGPAEVEVRLNKGQPNEVKGKFSGVQVRTYSPAFFQFLPSLSIAAQIAPSYELLARPEVHPQGRAVKPGEVAILYGTGFGPTVPVWPAGEIPAFASKIRDPMTLRIGGVLLAQDDIIYAGLSPGSISGLYQINVRVPATTPDGDIPVEVEIGGMRTQPGAFIPVRQVTTISPGTPIVGPPQ
ncbi:MAG TPA: hypothetical protein VLE22_11010 [Bryobacteraceae bacterium]|nr:hypothetical protein [Bryobacteraceae bacterium]